MLSNLAYDYHLLPCIIGAIWMWVVSYRSPESKCKLLIMLQFAVVIAASVSFESLCAGKPEEWIQSQAWWMISLGTAVQMPVAYTLGKKYPDSNRGVVLILVTLITTAVNALLFIDMHYQASLIKNGYNEVIFLLNVLAIGSCSRMASDGITRMVFGGHDSRRARLRRRYIDSVINRNKEQAQ